MKRPVLRYFGGKFRLASWVISHFPEHRCYVEPFGGAASVLMKKPRSKIEVWNDLDDSVFGLFQLLREGNRVGDLECALRLTPYCRRELELAMAPHPDPMENARRLIVRSFMGFGADSVTNRHSRTAFRSNSNKSNKAPALEWMTYPDSVHAFSARMMGVVVENKDAFEVMAQHDEPDTLHYVDPPYHLDTRGRRHRYAHEMGDRDQEDLIEFLKTLKGKVVLSGYDHPLYNALQWRRVAKEALADGARKRTEVLWMNFDG